MAGGRPKKTIDYDLVYNYASVMCTQEEIASFLDVSVRTLQRDDEFCRVFKRGIDEAKMSLRRYQFDSAKKGNVTMQIWLGKQYLDQRDKTDVEANISSDAFMKSLDKFADKL